MSPPSKSWGGGGGNTPPPPPRIYAHAPASHNRYAERHWSKVRHHGSTPSNGESYAVIGNVSGSQNYILVRLMISILRPHKCCIGVCKIASIGVDFWLLFFCSAKIIMTCTNSEIRRNFKMTTLASV